MSTRLIVVLMGLVCAGACSPEASQTEPAPEPFPNRRPQFAAEGHALGYVSNRFSDTISVIDLDRMALLGEAPVGRDPVDLDGPSPVSVDVRSGVAYTSFAYPESVVGAHEIVAGARGRNGYVVALALADLAPLGEVRVELEPLHVLYDAELDLLAVTHADSALALNLVDGIETRRATVGLMSGSQVRVGKNPEPQFLKTCVLPSAMGYDPKRKRLYVSCPGEDRVAILDAEKGTVVGLSPTGSSSTNKPGALVVGEPGILISNEVADTVVLLSHGDVPELLAECSVRGGPQFGLFTSEREALVPIQGPDAVVRLDLENNSIVQEAVFSVEDCQKPAELSRGHSGELWLVCEGDHYRPGRLVSLDPESLAILAGVPLGLYPKRMAVVKP
jgi:DNA-binding beta-propeller fold protein YncE